jgi:FKBP-type peptidyl-prolyl cis-trans isomerase
MAMEAIEENWSMDHSDDFNREIHVREEIDIQIYLEHHKDLRMIQTESGLRYLIISGGQTASEPPVEGQVVMLDVKTSLLTGRECYQADTTFILGRSDLLSGLQEGVKLMRVKDKARFILPSYLGEGLLGKGSIPPQAVLIVDAELLNIGS